MAVSVEQHSASSDDERYIAKLESEIRRLRDEKDAITADRDELAALYKQKCERFDAIRTLANLD
jgi:hypothetical protein